MGLKTFYLVGYMGDGLIADTIQATTGKYSHVAMRHPDLIHVSDVNYDHKFKTRHFRAKKGTYEMIPVLLDYDRANIFIDRHLETGYDFKGAVSCILPWVNQDPSKGYCSEMMRDLILYAGDYPVLESYRKTSITPTQIMRVIGGNK